MGKDSGAFASVDGKGEGSLADCRLVAALKSLVGVELSMYRAYPTYIPDDLLASTGRIRFTLIKSVLL